mmetsp:Transcript_129878/g.253040  ORF Transcript_129878/g.253040 Transcript_129878/m.253040 type:complete len:226 (-) Transcript_129878:12-689(-)
MFQIVLVLPGVPAAITESEGAFAIHHALLPLAFILATITPCEHTLTMEGVIFKGTLVGAAACCILKVGGLNNKVANAALDASNVLALIFCPILEGQDAVAMVHAGLPLALEDRTVTSHAGAHAIGLAVPPISDVYRALTVFKSAMSAGFVSSEIATVRCPVREELISFAVTVVPEPLASVRRAISEDKPGLAHPIVLLKASLWLLIASRKHSTLSCPVYPAALVQ